MSSGPQEVTRILQSGAPKARVAAELLPLLYGELRKLAAARMAKMGAGQTLQATALVNEAYVRLVEPENPGWENRGHFFFAAARAMKDIAVEHARKKATLKRGGDRQRDDRLDAIEPAIETPIEDVDLLTLDDVLNELEREDPQSHRIVMLRFFSGLTHAQVAEVIGSSERTVRREWRYTRARLHQRLRDR